MSAEDFNRRELEQGRLTWPELAAICQYADVNHLKENVKNGSLGWGRITQAVQAFQKQKGLDADGFAGSKTQSRALAEYRLQQPDHPSTVVPAKPIDDGWVPGVSTWKWFDGPAVRQPKNRIEVIEMFGDCGTLTENRGWTKKNVVDCHKSLGNQLPGVPEKFWIGIHRVVEPYLREALRRVQIAAPHFVIEKLGSHNWRPIRHKIGNPLSMHAWAIAIDLNDNINKGIDFPKGKSPQLWSDEFYEHWPKDDPRTITPVVMDCFRSCGFASGSDWDEDGLSTDQTYLDLMHMEWVARDGVVTQV